MRRGALVAWLLLLAACKREEQPPVAYYPAPAAAVPIATVPVPGGVPTPSAATAPAMPPAFGFFCGTDADPQCPFGRCIGGRCGGCASLADCKPGTQCLPSFVGQVCVPAPAAPPAPPTATPVGTPPTATSTPLERARQLCLTRSNEYRARVGVAPLSRRADAEACGDAQARADGASRTAHGAFGQCRERAQNECPGWNGDPETALDRCLAMMFAEGPGAGPQHGHYVNMTDARYHGVACGFSIQANGELWIVQDFYP